MGKPVVIIGDPSGAFKRDQYEFDNFKLLNNLGFRYAFPAPTNAIELRIQAVEYFLGLNIDGGPGILISELGCPNLIAALNGGYRYSKTRDGVSRPVPDKNESSHVIDALQCVCLVARSPMAYDWVNVHTKSEFQRAEMRRQRGSMGRVWAQTL